MNIFRQAILVLKQPSLIKPHIRIKRITELREEQLKGITTLIFDKDDTLTPHGSYQPPHDIARKLSELARNYQCLVVSNDPNLDSNKKVGSLSILRTTSKKPHNFPQIKQLLQRREPMLKASSMAIVGDRLFTDVYMANLNGCRSVLVEPLEPATLRKHGFWICFFRALEKRLL